LPAHALTAPNWQEGESGGTAKPWDKWVNCGASAGKARAKQEGESGGTAKPLDIGIFRKELKAKPMQLETREFRAEARFQRVSPQKARLVLALINGRRVGEALETVAFTKKGVAPLVEKVLRSAIQNANYLSQEQGLDVDVDNLYVKTALANDGPRMKRVRPAPMGRAYRYQRRLSHIVIGVAERKRAGLVETAEPSQTALKKRAAAKRAPAKRVTAKKSAAKKPRKTGK
jgi:large subunit ribosomal protein L22